MKTAIVTDSNSGITQALSRELGIYTIPMPVLINGEQFLEDISLTQEQFYEKLKDDSCQVSTSQPSAYDVGELWKKLLEEYDDIVCIPMSSGLSETCHSLQHLAETEFAGKVFVVDNRRISITQKSAVYDAIELVKQGKNAEEIAKWLTETSMQSSIYIMVNTLKYLKKGGRLTPAVAMIGTLLKIKPVLQIQGAKLDQFAKPRNFNKAKEIMIDAVKADLAERFAGLNAEGKMKLSIAYTDTDGEAQIFKKEVEEAFGMPVESVDPLSLSVSCHIGPGALAIACTVSCH